MVLIIDHVVDALFKFILVLLQYVLLNFAVFQRFNLDNPLLALRAHWTLCTVVLLLLHLQGLSARR